MSTLSCCYDFQFDFQSHFLLCKSPLLQWSKSDPHPRGQGHPEKSSVLGLYQPMGIAANAAQVQIRGMERVRSWWCSRSTCADEICSANETCGVMEIKTGSKLWWSMLAIQYGQSKVVNICKYAVLNVNGAWLWIYERLSDHSCRPGPSRRTKNHKNRGAFADLETTLHNL